MYQDIGELAPPSGNQPSLKANTKIRRRPTRKAGTADVEVKGSVPAGFRIDISDVVLDDEAAADKAIGWSAAEHRKREAELAEGFRKQGLEVYAPDVNAFRAHAQKVYMASDEAKDWPRGMLEKINALK